MTPAHCHVVIPDALSGSQAMSECAARFVKHLRARAEVFAPARVDVWCVGGEGASVRRLDDGRPVQPERIGGSAVHVLANTAFLLQDVPPFPALAAQAARRAVAVCATPGSCDAHALAWKPGRLNGRELRGALAALAATVGDPAAQRAMDDFGERPFAPDGSTGSPSLTLEGIDAPAARRSSEAPVHLNTALAELLAHPEDAAGVAGTLLARRADSAVPWIFNSLVNQIEYQSGAVEVASFPPEVHLSLTGVCNLECRFCAYTHDNAIRAFADTQRFAALDFLRHVRILRLSSGLGEPTLDRHLPDIVRLLVERFPQLALNFFTNGVALHRPGLIEALVGRVAWINVSLNAASAASWQEQHQADHFDRVCDNLLALRDAKRTARCLQPLVFASIVLNGRNLDDLPRLPALCRRLGIDRLSAFPYAALGYDTTTHTFGPQDTLERWRDRYDALHDETLDEARRHGVSVELPVPAGGKAVRFGLEVRRLHDFAGVERNEWPLAALADALHARPATAERCAFPWRIGCIGSTHRGSRAKSESHYMYPCIGPLSSADLSAATAFRFPDEAGMATLWNNPVFRHLRTAQSRRGVSPVCDHCRHHDSRDPGEFPALERLVAEFTTDMDALTAVRAPTWIRPAG
jgi:molybdenum cofactor biosynthesis enzyme MoaA